MISSTKLLKAIRAKCVDCCGDMKNEVLYCETCECPLYPFRLGVNYKTEIKKKKEEEEKE